MTHRASPIELVREGMAVVDAAGQPVGTVDVISMGDPEAATDRGSELQPRGDILSAAARALGDARTEPDVAEPLRSRLIRHGFLKVDGPDLLDTDRYVGADQIASVVGDAVTLRVRRGELPVEE
jgi:hypothetical protein